MIGNEKVNNDAKFMELFRRVSHLEVALQQYAEMIAELHGAVNAQPAKRETLRLRGR